VTRPREWSFLEDTAPAVAELVRSVIERWGFMLLGTIRQDGTPRISPAETHLVDGHLALALIAQSRKAADLRRDDRVTLQSPVTDARDPGIEVKVRGRLLVVDEDDLWQRIADAIEQHSEWRPARSWLVGTVVLDDVAVLQWHDGDMALTRWDPRHGVRRFPVRRLDMDASAYVIRG
jgi:hypothetical protein